MTAGIKMTRQEVAVRMAAFGFELIGDYRNMCTKTEVRCNRHNMTFIVLPNNIVRGQRLMCCKRERLREFRTGIFVSEETKKRIAAVRSGTTSSFESIIRGARSRPDAGVRGFFYIARIMDGSLKFGSTIRTMPGRLPSLKNQENSTLKVLLVAQVPDARGYEATMMERYREHWIRGERFRDFLAV